MKKFIYTLLIGASIVGSGISVSSCSDFTDVQPKGKNLLSTTDQLEMLLNYEYDFSCYDFPMMCGDIIHAFENIPTLINKPNKTRPAIIISWDESNQDKMAELTQSDADYADCYGIIGKIANPILSLIDEATGSEKVKKQLKCEALVLRAYFHYILVNKFAKAYNPATAANDNGIPYVMDDWDVAQPTEPLTVQQVYEHILDDLEEAITIDALPSSAVNRMRMSKACAYAAKALALISMQKFDEAEVAAKQALGISGTVNNYNEMTTAVVDGYVTGGTYNALLRPRLTCEEDLFYTHNLEFFDAITTEAENAFEEGHVCHEKMTTDRMIYDYVPGMGMGLSYIGLDYTFTYDLSSGWNYAGMKTTQMYLIIAEAEIHQGNYDNAMEALDAIRVNRIDPAKYAALKGTVRTEAEAISHLKQTSHGENIYSYYNFINRKRWNQVEGYKETLTRDIAGQKFTLTPDSPLWIFPLPVNALSNNPNLSQNYKN